MIQCNCSYGNIVSELRHACATVAWVCHFKPLKNRFEKKKYQNNVVALLRLQCPCTFPFGSKWVMWKNCLYWYPKTRKGCEGFTLKWK